MILYRTIGLTELNILIKTGTVNGRYHILNECQSSGTIIDAICTFTEPIKWHDKNHQFFVILDIPESQIIEHGTGKYYAAKNFAETKIWTGRRGKTEYILNEAYLSNYSIQNVVKIYAYSPDFTTTTFNELTSELTKFNINSLISDNLSISLN